MTTPRKRRPKYPGVVLIKPDPERRIGWRARYVDPDSGNTIKESLDAALTTIELRDDWAVRKAKALDKRRLELNGGAPRATGTDFSAAIDRYFEDHPQLRAGTKGIYRTTANKLQSWAERNRIASADDLTGPKLVAFRALLVREQLLAPVKGGRRGQLKPTGKQRSPQTVNRELRAARTVLGYLRKLGLLPRVSTDDLRDGLERLQVSHDANEYLKPHELQKLLEAALRHDSVNFTETRQEHVGKHPLGTTGRYDPIAPFVAGALLTGMRLGEVVELDWKQVDLEALDNDGKAVGEIHLSSVTKTKRARTVGLEVSPALHKMLAAMHVKTGGKGSVFGLTRDTAKAAAKRLRAEYGAPEAFGWQELRQTCGTFLTNAPGIFGAASAYRSAKQLGHSVAVAERHYVGVLRGIPASAKNLETAMQIEGQMKRIIEAVGARAKRQSADSFSSLDESSGSRRMQA